MSDINLDFTVANNNINFTVEPNDITFTPTDIQLTFNPNFQPLAGGNITQLQYNNGGILAGIPTATYTGGNLTLGNVANLKITGGTNGYVLQTDGAGNLAWTAQTGGGGNGSPGGSNTQIQYNDNGLFGGNVGFTFNEVSGNVAMPGNLAVTGNVTGNVQTAYLANYATTANAVAGANVSGTVANATYAISAGTVTTNAQPNITSVGTLTSLAVTGNIAADSYLGSLGNVIYGIENLSIIGAQTGTYNMDLINSAIKYSTANASANLILNFRGNSSVSLNTLLANSHSITSTYVFKNGTTSYSISSITIDSAAQSIKWVNGTIPTAASNAYTSYTFTIVKTSTTPTYDVLGSATRYS
jgi:hypothetical protein